VGGTPALSSECAEEKVVLFVLIAAALCRNGTKGKAFGPNWGRRLGSWNGFEAAKGSDAGKA
jgi:hypothetical protein